MLRVLASWRLGVFTRTDSPRLRQAPLTRFSKVDATTRLLVCCVASIPGQFAVVQCPIEFPPIQGNFHLGRCPPPTQVDSTPQRPRLCMTGISRLAVRRAVVSLDRNTFHCAGRAQVHLVGLSLPLHPPPMLGAAVKKKAEAANQPSRPPANNAALAKQLFPSSSPSPAPGKRSEHTIANMFTKKTSSLGSGGPSRPTTAAKPLQNHPLNVPPQISRGVNGKGFASLVNRSDSFEEEPEVIDLVSSSSYLPTGTLQPNNSAPSVYFHEDDFSDDADLDLDFGPVSALPRVPQAVPNKHDDPPPASNTSVLSWSQSSPSHLQPPQPRAVPPPPPPKFAKRASPVDDEPAPKAAKKSKRELPWPKRSAQKEEDLDERYGAAAATPAAKTKGPMLWNTTASAVKAQKKQLKTQSKESVKPETSLEDMHEAVKSHTKKAAAIVLSNEQRHVKSLVVDKGQSVFFTGPAGTGKSVLMRAIIQELKRKHARDPERVAVTASTGLAACNIGGMTLHSFSGIGLGKEDTNTLVKKIRRNPKAKTRWLKTKTLIIDEVSMVDAELFDKLSQIGRIIRNNGRPWGGIQLVITGDFFQLPPVPDGGKQRESKFAFDAATWSMSIDHTIGLTEVFRQRDPGKLVSP